MPDFIKVHTGLSRPSWLPYNHQSVMYALYNCISDLSRHPKANKLLDTSPSPSLVPSTKKSFNMLSVKLKCR